MKSMIRAFALLFAGLYALPAVLSAQVFTYNFDFVPEGEIVTNATGFATVTIDSQTNFLTWEVTFADLTSGLNNAHFHGPAGPDDPPAGVLEGLDIMEPEATGLTSGTLSGSTTTTAFATETILDGLAYINLHTIDNPGGEIRGQVIPEPRTYALIAGMIALGGAIFWRRWRIRRE